MSVRFVAEWNVRFSLRVKVCDHSTRALPPQGDGGAEKT